MYEFTTSKTITRVDPIKGSPILHVVDRMYGGSDLCIMDDHGNACSVNPHQIDLAMYSFHGVEH